MEKQAQLDMGEGTSQAIHLCMFCPRCRTETPHLMSSVTKTRGGSETERYLCLRCRKHVAEYVVT